MERRQVKKIINRIRSFFSQGNERSLRAKKNIVVSFILKGLSIAVSLMLVPLTLNYLDKTHYGIWLTLTSILGWMYFFDIGLGNGLRNKFAEAKAYGNVMQGRMYVSTTFALLTLISVGLLLLFMIINPFLNWTKILNTDASLAQELSKTVFITFTFFCLQFVFRLVGTILLADQKPAMNDFLNLCSNILSLGIIFVLTKITVGSLLGVSFVFSLTPVLVFMIAAFVMFNKKYKEYTPAIKFVNFHQINDLMGLGVKFFIIQIAGLVLFTTTNIIISQLFGPAEVTPYNIAFKYFSVMTMAFNIILSPFWTAFTDAYHKKEIIWIKQTTKKLVAIWGVSCLVLVVMVMAANWIYHLWIGTKISVHVSLSIMIAIFIAIYNWNNIFAFFINGVGKIKLQLYYAVFVGFINLPLSIILAKLLNGVEGIVLSTCLCLLIGSILQPIQYLKIINGTAKGIWNK